MCKIQTFNLLIPRWEHPHTNKETISSHFLCLRSFLVSCSNRTFYQVRSCKLSSFLKLTQQINIRLHSFFLHYGLVSSIWCKITQKNQQIPKGTRWDGTQFFALLWPRMFMSINVQLCRHFMQPFCSLRAWLQTVKPYKLKARVSLVFHVVE